MTTTPNFDTKWEDWITNNGPAIIKVKPPDGNDKSIDWRGGDGHSATSLFVFQLVPFFFGRSAAPTCFSWPRSFAGGRDHPSLPAPPSSRSFASYKQQAEGGEATTSSSIVVSNQIRKTQSVYHRFILTFFCAHHPARASLILYFNVSFLLFLQYAMCFFTDAGSTLPLLNRLVSTVGAVAGANKEVLPSGPSQLTCPLRGRLPHTPIGGGVPF
jgi:hypothetical protein